MAISETTLKDVMLMLIEEQNKKGGLLGKKLEAVVVDPASNWPLFAEKARELITKDKVAAVFGCWTSVSRKSVLPVFKELNSDPVLSGAVRRRGERAQRVLHRRRPQPAGDPGRRLPDEGRGRSSAGCSRAPTTSIRAPPTRSSRPISSPRASPRPDIMINYTPFGHSDWQTIVADIKKFGSAGKKTAVVSTINGDANVPFYKELGNQGVKATDIPVGRLLGRRGRARRHRHQAAARPPRRLELLPVDQDAGQQGVHRRSGRPSSRTTSASPTTRWKPTSSASPCGSRRSRRPAPPIPTR